MSDGMGRELVYLSSHATNRYFIPNWGINETIDFIRRKKKEQEKADSYRLLTADNIYSDRYFDGDKAQALLLAAVATLPEVQRTVFTLRYFHEMKYSEISNILNTSEGALKASFHIASKKIHDFIESND